MSRDQIHFVTGKLAEPQLRDVLGKLAPAAGFEYTIDVLGITVAALMTPAWVAKRIRPPAGTTRVILPGYCHGDLQPVAAAAGVPVDRGPKDLRELPQFFGQTARPDYGAHSIEIVAEINHAPRQQLRDILAQAEQMQADGADLIDVGCDPGAVWNGVGECVKALREAGHRVSIDSLNPDEIEAAIAAGAELVLSVNSSNRDRAVHWGCEVVVVPDDPATLAGLDETVHMLAEAGVRLRIDPVLEPIGFGFAASLGRCLAVRQKWPDAQMLMGIGNLTELTDVDSAGVNVLLLGFCQELGIHSVLTTQVINWARTSVRECDLARRLVHYAVTQSALPKNTEPRLVTLRDPRLLRSGPEAIRRLAEQIKDHSYRIIAEEGQLHLLTAGTHLQDSDPFDLFEKLLATNPKHIDASHAFYLGYEMAKAATALTLSKNYQQDEALDWGYLTVEEVSHRKRVASDECGVSNEDKVSNDECRVSNENQFSASIATRSEDRSPVSEVTPAPKASSGDAAAEKP